LKDREGFPKNEYLINEKRKIQSRVSRIHLIGTIAYEMMEVQGLKDLDAILVPISGGGMTAGIAIAAKAINPSIKGYLNTYLVNSYFGEKLSV
jgi:hypothetical protein